MGEISPPQRVDVGIKWYIYIKCLEMFLVCGKHSTNIHHSSLISLLVKSPKEGFQATVWSLFELLYKLKVAECHFFRNVKFRLFMLWFGFLLNLSDLIRSNCIFLFLSYSKNSFACKQMYLLLRCMVSENSVYLVNWITHQYERYSLKVILTKYYTFTCYGIFFYFARYILYTPWFF